MTKSTAKVIFVCGREPEYVRNAMIWQTIDQHFDSRLIADSRSGSLSSRIARVIPRLLYYLKQPHDLLVVGFYGHPLVILAQYFTQAPILFDAFVSTYDTLCYDRAVIAPGSIPGKIAFQLDKQATHSADKVLLDTNSHSEYFQQTFSLLASKLDTLYLGCDETIFYPKPSFLPADEFIVFTYSSYMPLHGVETIIKAAELCQQYPIKFRLVGSGGPTYQRVRQIAQQIQLSNVEFVPTLPFSQLPAEIARASVCLGGHFGSTAKATRVIAGKTYQFMAMGKPVILGINEANQELFQHLETAYFCEMNDAADLANAIIKLYHNDNLRQMLSKNVYDFFKARLSWSQLSKKLIDVIYEML